MKKISLIFIAILLISFSVYADGFQRGGGLNEGDLDMQKYSIQSAEVDATPSTPPSDEIKLYAKDDAGTTKLYTLDSTGTETELGAGGGGINYWSLSAGNVGINTTNNVGIGSVNPTQKLDIEGTAQAQAFELQGYSTSTPALFPSSDTNTGVRFSGPDILQLETGGSTGITITSAQNVGVGTSVVNSKLAVNGGAVIGTGYMATVAPSNGLIVQGNVGVGTVNPYSLLDVQKNRSDTISPANAGLAVGDYAHTGSLLIQSLTSNNFVLQGSNPDGSYKAYGISLAPQGGGVGIGTTITSNAGLSIMNGNVGIGTWKPVQQLQTSGNIGIGTDSTGTSSLIVGGNNDFRIANIANPTQRYLQIQTSSGGASVFGYGSSANTLTLGHGGTNDLTISASGNVGIGSTNPNSILETNVNTGSVATGLRLTNSATSATQGRGVKISATGTGGTDFADIYMDTYTAANNNGRIILRPYSSGSAINALAIIPSGNVGIGSISPNSLLNVNGNVGIGTTGTGSTPYQLNVNNVAVFNSEYTNANIGIGTTTIDWNKGNYQNVGIGTSSGAYIAFTHPTNGGVAKLQLRIKQDGTGSRVVSFWPATVLWTGGTAPTLTTTAGKSDIINCTWNGVNDYCASTLNF